MHGTAIVGGGAEGVGVWVLASSSCLKPSRKSQQSSYRDDCWSGGFHPAPQGSRYTPPPPAPHHCSPPLPPTHLLRAIVQPSITDSGQQPLACAAVGRLCSISTPEEVSHKHRAAAKNRRGPSRAPPNPSATEFRQSQLY